ncbi:hypothetical protein HA050_09600 [Iodobacter sp. HSC-16F04]|uniref:Glycosyl hydrolase family 32 N-terminal domain-containing protein n=1 Tax=Iodobacter violaceini TaxID=3044271 RepID=A0ABX0KUK3_9NEIS|nr:hypothetical protein [Iodobacter violacea]NHQ86368.1 hypothetical protein [Iodobacter violacea]
MTKQIWQRIGRLFEPNQQRDWLHSHAANPMPLVLADGRVRIYFNYRNTQNCAGVAWLDWQPDDEGLGKIIAIAETPVLLPGEAGSYDDSGISLGCITPVNHELWLYYIGWNLAVTVPWRNSIGIATGTLDGVFKRPKLAPVLDRHEHDPYSLSYPWVLRDANQKWHMWYGSTLTWGVNQGGMQHVLKYASSADGQLWQREGVVCLDLLPGEIALTRPCVCHDGHIWRMWYSIRTVTQYSIGYAESDDGIRWQRHDEYFSWQGNAEEWESFEQTYPCVFQYGKEWYMIYNGNHYGATGFGLAKLVLA